MPQLNHLASLVREPFGTLALVAAGFVVAWLVSRLSGRLAERIVRRYETGTGGVEHADTSVLIGLKRRDTAISLVRTSVRYLAYGIAVVYAITSLLSGSGRGGAVFGASLLVVLIGFAAQRLLLDILTGVFVFFEDWFAVGDVVTFQPYELTGVVEEVSLRSTKLRAVTGETIRVHNSYIQAMRLLPRGVREVSIELFVRDEEAGRALIDDAARVMPVGPTQFVQPPWIEEVNRLDPELIHIRARATTVPGREFLAFDFLPKVIGERAPEDLVVHGPVVMTVDDRAAQRFARTLRVPTGRI